MKRLWAAHPWIDVIAVVPFVLLVLLSPDPMEALGRIDPFIFFRVFVLVWVLYHVILVVRRFIADVRSLGDMLIAADRRLGQGGRVGRIGTSVLKWSALRVVRLAVRYGWLTALLMLTVTAVNATAMLVLSGRL